MTEADVREMVSVICALEMDLDTISDILFLMKMIMMSALRDLSPRNGEKALRDILRRRTKTNIYIKQFLYRVKLTYQARQFNFFPPLS